MTSDQLKTLGKRTTIISFIIGTIIFGLYILTSASNLIFLGYFCLVLAGLINFVMLVFIFARSNRENKLLKICGLMLLNIPVALLYCCIVTYIITHNPNNYY